MASPYGIPNKSTGNDNSETFDFGGRSYVSMSYKPSLLSSSLVNTGVEVHEQTANLASVLVTESLNEDENEDDLEQQQQEQHHREEESQDHQHSLSESSLLMPNSPRNNYFSQADALESEIGSPSVNSFGRRSHSGSNPSVNSLPQPSPSSLSLSSKDNIPEKQPSKLHSYLVKPIRYIPGVFLGTLLNILDGLSYGMIMFPISESIFASLAPAGLSMFYMSCIISQLIYSLGGSAFKAGKLKLGVLVGFFPRHILVGCIGGVGYFLIATGIEVSSRLEGGLSYNYETFKYLFYNHTTLLEWTIPLLLALILIILQHKYHNSLLVPLYFIAVFIIFHLSVAVAPSWNLNNARINGWIFPMVEDNEPWYSFYSLYKFNLVDWVCIVRQIPTMLALTFFGILHVPINVPALAVSVGMDQVDVDRELVAHGYSNAISGLVGSIQNYLVYTNSVLFIRAGADDRVAGVMLAIATAAVMMVGPVVIGYIPVCVVGALIYLLGYELLKEAIYDTWGRLRNIEYITIIIIVVTMGAVDFVAGIGVGIYSGSVARSTVMRHPKQQEFLKNVGEQICIVKLQGTLFFGSIGGVEKEIRNMFEHDKFKSNPIKYLIIDMKGVISLDFSAAEGFRRILNLANDFKTQFIISSVGEDDDIIQGLRDAGIFDNGANAPIELFSSLNYALEWCENSFLKTYSKLKKSDPVKTRSVPGSSTLTTTRQSFASPSSYGAKIFAASKTVYDEHKTESKFESQKNSLFQKQPLSLIMLSFQGLSDKDAEFWSNITPYFVKEKIPENYQFYDTKNDEPAFFIVESGLIRSIIKFESEGRELHSSILPLVAFGDLDDASEYRQIIYTTVNDTVVWKLTQAKLKEMLAKLGSKGEELYHELLEVEAKLIRGRFDTMTANLIIAG
ncbi:Sulfate transporter family protein [Candida albicans]|uniref:Sulfate transporter family protein n=1 Tax=Candida albicans TaxID=5476 RepID=A0A8H6C369_CANAX|nr:Sulfate transporter family protein [Candida albicans]